MAFITADRVKDTSTTTGTGNITVSGSAPFGYRTFSTVLSVSDTFYYCIQGQATAEWEVGLGTYVSSNQFARTTVLASSASGSAVSFSSGTKNVFITLPANKTLQLDAAASPTAGAILYGTGSMLTYTAVGTSGQFLQSTGSGAPTWAPLGSVGTSISNGNSNVNIASSNGAVTVATNGTTAMTVDTSQNVGIGTASPGYKLTVNGQTSFAANQYVRIGAAFFAAGDGSTINYLFCGSAALAVRNSSDSTEFMRIDSSGNVGIGTASPGAKFAVSDGTVTIVTSPYAAGSTGYFGTSTNHSLSILTNNTEKMRIDTSGNLLVGTTSALNAISTIQNAGGGQLTLRNSTTASGRYWSIGSDSGSSFIVYNNSGVGVYVNYGGTAWIANSDERLKDIIEPIADGLAKVNTLRAIIGAYKSDEEKTRRPFLIAQDVQAVLPEAVDASDPDKLGLAYSEVIPLLVAAIQELSAKNDALETRLAALETK